MKEKLIFQSMKLTPLEEKHFSREKIEEEILYKGDDIIAVGEKIIKNANNSLDNLSDAYIKKSQIEGKGLIKKGKSQKTKAENRIKKSRLINISNLELPKGNVDYTVYEFLEEIMNTIRNSSAKDISLKTVNEKLSESVEREKYRELWGDMEPEDASKEAKNLQEIYFIRDLTGEFDKKRFIALIEEKASQISDGYSFAGHSGRAYICREIEKLSAEAGFPLDGYTRDRL